MRENLVDAATSHHIPAQEQGHQPIAHIIHSARPPAQSQDLGRAALSQAAAAASALFARLAVRTQWAGRAEFATALRSDVAATSSDVAATMGSVGHLAR
jgi:hypothetical protein